MGAGARRRWTRNLRARLENEGTVPGPGPGPGHVQVSQDTAGLPRGVADTGALGSPTGGPDGHSAPKQTLKPGLGDLTRTLSLPLLGPGGLGRS